MDLFDMVPDNFFSLLSSKNKRLYLAAILQTFKVYETGSILGIDKRIVVDDLIYYLDTHSYLYDVEDEEDEDADPKTKRELANYVLRRMEECGWIYVDVTNDYEEVLNFSDIAITICEALFRAYPQFEYQDEYPEDYINPMEYQGYIYNIYSLLSQTEGVNYELTFKLVYQTTKQLIRAIRKLDARMKDYIQSVVDTTEIKDLMERLIMYKTDIYDSSYMKLKVSDNVDRYRLSIVTRLKEISQNELAVKEIANNYLATATSIDDAISKAVKHIDEVIDAFNAIEEFVKEIDNKNRNYINSTIGKVKFLLSEEDNVVGKLNAILKYIKDSNKNNKLDKAIRLAENLYDLRTQKLLSMESLYTPRGNYARNYEQVLDESGLDFEMTDEFLEQFKTAYNEEYISNFMNSYMVGGELQASKIIEYDSDDDLVINLVYCIILAVDKHFTVEIVPDYIKHKKFIMKDFIIRR